MSSILNADRINDLNRLIERKKHEKLDIITELVNLIRLQKLGSLTNNKRIEELENKNAVLEEIIVRNEEEIKRLQNPKPKQDRLAFLRDTLSPDATKHLTKGITELNEIVSESKKYETPASYTGLTKEDEDMMANAFDMGGGRRAIRVKRKSKKSKRVKRKSTRRVKRSKK